MEKTLTNYAMAGVHIKRFTYIRDGKLIASKPKPTEKFILIEDLLGNKSLMWVACIDIETDAEKWRHNVSDIVRITYETHTTTFLTTIV